MILGGSGCFGPNPDYLGLNIAGADTGSDTGEPEDEGVEPRVDLEPSVDLEETGTETETGADSGDPEPSCGDQNPDVGEFCFVVVELLALPEVQSLAIADFDADGIDDIAVARKDDVLTLFGDGVGGFPLQVDLPEPGSEYRGAAAGDLDGDQIADLVVSQDSADAVLVYRSLGGGSFAEPFAFAAGDQPRRLELLDLDGDAVLDLVVALAGQDRVAVLLGDGQGGFLASTSFASGGDQPVELGVGLFDADTIPDLVVGNLNDESLAVLLGAPPGALAEPQVYPLAGRPRSTVVADFNLDGRLDVAAVLEDLDRVQILHGDGLGGLVEQEVQLAVGDRPMAAVADDFNLDGVPDLLVANRDDASVGILFGAPERSGQFLAQKLVVGFDGFFDMSVVARADLDDDGVMDVVIGGTGVRAMISDP